MSDSQQGDSLVSMLLPLPPPLLLALPEKPSEMLGTFILNSANFQT
jgi:hypothetical protein